MTTLAEFLDRVVAPGNWLCVTSKRGSNGLVQKFYPRADVAVAAGYLTRAAGRGYETWFAVASFQTAGNRRQANVEQLKAFWVDADIARTGDGKDPTRVFADDQEVIRWVKGFVSATNIPRPNLWIKSGYGLHLYWCLKDALTKDRWQPHADALKALLVAHKFKGDTLVTADAARILRPIETWNYKVPADPKPCLEVYTIPDYPNDMVLRPLTTTGVSLGLATPPPHLVTPGSGSLAAAQSQSEYPPADFETISRGCAQVAKSLASGGDGDTRPVWWPLINLTMFCNSGREWAHRIGEKHPKYTKAETDRECDRAVADRVSKPGLGAPRCATFDAARPGICPACPHFIRAASPYSLGFADLDELPAGFRYDKGWIMHGVLRGKGSRGGKGGTGEMRWERVIQGRFSNPRLDAVGEQLKLTVDFTDPGRRQRTVAFLNNELTTTSTPAGLLCQRGIHTHYDHGNHARKFLMSWISKLDAALKVNRNPAPAFGWYRGYVKNFYRGFATGGDCYLTSGGEETVRGVDPNLLERYERSGDMAEWQEAASFVASGGPELQTAIAASFGAPLMVFTGEAAATLSLVGKSGTGKSSAFKAGAAVWGRPLMTMMQLSDTTTYKNIFMSNVQALPVYWDEIRITDPARLIEDLHLITQGRDKGRGTTEIKARVPGEWSTLSITSSNDSLCDIISDRSGYNDPTFLRMLEVNLDNVNLPLIVNAGNIVQKFDWNYGIAGRVYARYIADNVPLIQGAIRRVRTEIAAQITALDNEERFYLAVAAAVEIGAVIARKLNIIDLNRKGIRDVLCNAIVKARQVRHGYTPPTARERLSRVLDEFLRDHSQEMIVTRSIAKPGPRTKLEEPIHQPQATVLKNQSLVYQIGVDDKLLRISLDHWSKWCRDKGLSPLAYFSEMNKLWGMEQSRGAMGGGTHFHITRTRYYEVSLAHPDLSVHLEPYLARVNRKDIPPGKIVPLRTP